MRNRSAVVLVALLAAASPAFAQSTTPVTIKVPIAFSNLDPSINAATIQCALTGTAVGNIQPDGGTIFNPGGTFADATIPIANGANTQSSATLTYSLTASQLAGFVSYACKVFSFTSSVSGQVLPTSVTPAVGTSPKLVVYGPLTSTAPATPRPQPIHGLPQ